MAFAAIDFGVLIAFICFAYVGVGASSMSTTRKRYRRIDGAPPAWVFPVVWGALYGMIAASGFLVWFTKAETTVYWIALSFYAANLALNKLWTPLFFEARKPGWALAVLVGMQGFAIAYVVLASLLTDTPELTYTGVGLYAPYVLWCCYAGYLNYQYVVRNKRGEVIYDD